MQLDDILVVERFHDLEFPVLVLLVLMDVLDRHFALVVMQIFRLGMLVQLVLGTRSRRFRFLLLGCSDSVFIGGVIFSWFIVKVRLTIYFLDYYSSAGLIVLIFLLF